MELKTTDVFEKQFENKRFIINQGGTRAGKTFAILQALITIANGTGKSLIISIVSESLPHLKRGAMRDFFAILESLECYDVNSHNKSNYSYKINNTTFEFFGVDADSKVRGAARDILFINECNNIKYDTFRQLEVRTKYRIFLDYNPTNEFWAHTDIMQSSNYKNTYHYIKSTYKDNKFLHPNIVKSIESRQDDINWWRVYGLGELGMVEGLVFTDWRIVKNMPTCKWIAYGLDFGYVNDPSALVRVGMSEGELFAEQIFYQTHLTNTDIINLLKKNNIDIRDEIFCDSSEPKSIHDLYQAGYNAKAVIKGADSIINGIDIIKRHKLNITEGSIDLIKELRSYMWQKDKEGKIINKPIDKYNHAGDALRYCVMMKIGQKPKPFYVFA